MRLVFINYSSGRDGVVTSEWADDKLRALEELGHSVTLITSLSSSLHSSPSRRVIKVPSFGWKDFSDELQVRSINSLNYDDVMVRLALGLWKVISQTLGRLFDSLFRQLAGTYSDGRWSWFIAAVPVAVWQAARYRKNVILSTGGPSVAHLVAMVAGKITTTDFYSELQDPLIGSEMVLSKRSRSVLENLERSLCKNAKRLIFVTQIAAERALERNPFAAERVVCIYPGAFDFKVAKLGAKLKEPKQVTGEIVLAHLGHLYGSRNLDLVFRAIDELVADGELDSNLLKIWNVGPAHVAMRAEYLARSDYQEFPLGERLAGIKKAAQADFLLLVQHSDSRSNETIPYKTYDYLNLGLPILAIINNPELGSLLGFRGIIGSATNLAETKTALRKVAQSHGSNSLSVFDTGSPFSLTAQVNKIFSTEDFILPN